MLDGHFRKVNASELGQDGLTRVTGGKWTDVSGNMPALALQKGLSTLDRITSILWIRPSVYGAGYNREFLILT